MAGPAALAIFTSLLLHERLSRAEVAAIEGGAEAVDDLISLGVLEADEGGYAMTAWARRQFPLAETAEPDPQWVGHDPDELLRRLAQEGSTGG